LRDIVVRQLDIGASKRISGFETLNAVRGRNIDHVADARNLPFRDNTFATIYASHVLEHIPWIETQRAVDEWVRCLAHGGRLEVWVPDALRVARKPVLCNGRLL
jgi:predicted SAM-dependent methyltransferase